MEYYISDDNIAIVRIENFMGTNAVQDFKNIRNRADLSSIKQVFFIVIAVVFCDFEKAAFEQIKIVLGNCLACGRFCSNQ